MIGLLRPSCIVLSQSRGGKKQGGGASEQGGRSKGGQPPLIAWAVSVLKFIHTQNQCFFVLFYFKSQPLSPYTPTFKILHPFLSPIPPTRTAPFLLFPSTH